MIYLGSLAQILSVSSASFAVVAALWGAKKQNDSLVLLARQATKLHFYLLLICVFCLLYLLALPDFSVAYVTNHVNHKLPMFYRLTSIWAGQAGSMLWWNFLLVLFSVVAIEDIQKKEPSILPYSIVVLMGSSLFFTLLANFSADSDPFQLVSLGDQPFVVPDGRGLNPLLQHWAMIIHPPILYVGYVSFAIPFAIALGALIQRKIDINWFSLIRRWSIFSWFFLGVGMLLGGKWAYEELGWGGYWAWDPVENAALMPWITSTAFLHSILVQEKRGMLKVWNMVLVSLSFIMCIFGTFLTRSGVVSSVHAFASSDLGPFFVIYMVILIIFSAYFIFSRISILRTSNPFHSFLSREAGFLYNNLMLLIALFIVIWGTMYPTITEALFSERVSVTSVWFNDWMVPVGLIILFLMGTGPLLSWRKTSKEALIRNFRYPLLIFFMVLFIYAFWLFSQEKFDVEKPLIWAGFTFAISAFVIAGILEEFYRMAHNRIQYTKENLWLGFIRGLLQNKRRYVGYLVHIALAVLYVGFAGNAFSRETKMTLRKGESEYFSGFLFHLNDHNILQYKGEKNAPPLYVSKQLDIWVYRNNYLLGRDTTEIRTYPMYNLSTQRYDDNQNTSEPAIIPFFLDDVYIQFGGVLEDSNRLVLQIWINPLVRVVWIGFAFFIFSGLLLLIPIGEKKKVEPSRK